MNQQPPLYNAAVIIANNADSQWYVKTHAYVRYHNLPESVDLTMYFELVYVEDLLVEFCENSHEKTFYNYLVSLTGS